MAVSYTHLDPDFQNNIILTQTERLTMNSRPKQPKYARNKNVCLLYTSIMQDDITKVQISKKDLTTKEELPGAELTLADVEGNEIDRWISTDTPHRMEKLPAGKYTLTEVTAPDGYATVSYTHLVS